MSDDPHKELAILYIVGLLIIAGFAIYGAYRISRGF